ncbi:MAG: restriction endonuclease [Planctomycetes bacterium]|nr:restriction endonuclease [Planctomycetota bacterium]
MIDFKEIEQSGEIWELFSRDFLQQLGFYIETPPNRGPDGGKDMLVTEELKGKFHSQRFRWLVSCKHNAHSEKSVNENDDEKNILERVQGFNADGFMGVYSTIASCGLNDRLEQLRNNKKISEYRIFDHKLIENHLITMGFSQLVLRYFPESYKSVRPIHLILDEFVPLNCDHCGKDLLEALYKKDFSALVASATKYDEDGKHHILDTYFACKGKCDKVMEARMNAKYETITDWEDLSDIAMPNQFLRWIMSIMNELSDENYIYSKDALKKQKQLIMALSQKVFREVTPKERERMLSLVQFGL